MSDDREFNPRQILEDLHLQDGDRLRFTLEANAFLVAEVGTVTREAMVFNPHKGYGNSSVLDLIQRGFTVEKILPLEPEYGTVLYDVHGIAWQRIGEVDAHPGQPWRSTTGYRSDWRSLFALHGPLRIQGRP